MGRASALVAPDPTKSPGGLVSGTGALPHRQVTSTMRYIRRGAHSTVFGSKRFNNWTPFRLRPATFRVARVQP
jgi:hypothetical protein